MPSKRTADDVDRVLGDRFRSLMATYMRDLAKEVSSLDPQDPGTLPLVISSLTRVYGIDQGDIAKHLKQSRIQVGRWSRGDHIPRNDGYRAFLVEELLKYIRGKAQVHLREGIG
jgi:hypothetical protein